MQGKHVVITGATTGIGRSTAREIARRGATVTLLCRSAEKARELCAEIEADGAAAPRVVLLDLASLESVRKAAAQLLATGEAIDVLLNNAGVINTARRESVDGFEETLAVNHFAPFLLTGLLLPLVQQAAHGRIVNVASDAHAFVRDMGFDDIQSERRYSTFNVYGRSKLANILFTRELSRRLAGSGVTVNCLHPGAVSTGLGTQNGFLGRILPLLLKPFFRTPDKGAESSIYLACSDEIADVSGEYFVDCRIAKAKPWASDMEAATRLWQYTEECVGFSYA
ncbi:MAG: SDR family oxidoreductase [Halioglobus sp.]|nr:SDR family oxidoreductase [Halioglobus sp.]